MQCGRRQTTVSAAWVGACRKVRLCPSVVRVCTLGGGGEWGQAKQVRQTTQQPCQLSQIIDVHIVHVGYIGYTQLLMSVRYIV